uniref:DNA topoisomerase (ATP-hydrolyzing) n=1 Tax=Opuntia streptacantha TaxID=393608 RepID=A0A7C8YPV0_OPUST
MKKSIALALDDLKEKYSGILPSAHALKIQSYAPDLAKSIAGLILSADDSIFQHECFSILRLQLGNIEQDSVENRIKDKIISAIDMNDSKARQLRCREPAAFLFGDDPIQEHEYMLDECEEGEEEDYTLMDF